MRLLIKCAAESSELAGMMQELDVEPMPHVLEEVIEEVDKARFSRLSDGFENF